jgi:hypothetical protein
MSLIDDYRPSSSRGFQRNARASALTIGRIGCCSYRCITFLSIDRHECLSARPMVNCQWHSNGDGGRACHAAILVLSQISQADMRYPRGKMDLSC